MVHQVTGSGAFGAAVAGLWGFVLLLYQHCVSPSPFPHVLPSPPLNYLAYLL